MLPQSRNSRRGAYTLAEVLVVVLILGASAAIVVPRAMDDSDVQAKAAARCLAGDLEYARDMAITTARSVTISFNVTGGSYTLSTKDPVTNATVTMIHPISHKDYAVTVKAQAGMDRVKIESAFGSTSAATVTFDLTGAPDTSGSITLKAGTRSFKVDVAAATGKVSVTAL